MISINLNHGSIRTRAMCDRFSLAATERKNHKHEVISSFLLVIGEFGLYAAACGCQVFLFEVQPSMVNLIRTSIALNNFSASRVHIVQKAVSNLPSHTRLTFSVMGGQTTVSNGTLQVSTIRLDDVPWPEQSKILLLKVDVEGFELNVIRSAEKLFREKRVHHLIFEYTAWWTDRAAQNQLLPLVERELGAKTLYALDRQGINVYGPLTQQDMDLFQEKHVQRHLQTDIYAIFVESNERSTLEVQPYDLGTSFA